MFTIFSQRNYKNCLHQSSQDDGRENSKESRGERELESFRKYRDSVIWHLLQLERHIDKNDLSAYWKLIDAIMDLSLKSAITILKTRYGYRLRKLHSNGNKPAKELYRLEHNNKSGYRDVCVNSLLRKTIALLQSEVKRLT